jgi:predicted TPR repeat methyltransferase
MTRLALKPSALLSPSDDGYLVYDVDAQRLHRLNPSACLVIELCDGARDLDELRGILRPLVGDAGWDACRGWIDQALQDGWLGADPDPVVSSSISADTLAALAGRLRDQDHVLPAFICQQRAAELAPDDPQMWYHLGELAHIVGRRDDARAAYERYYARHPEDAEIGHVLTALRDAAPPARVPDRCVVQLYERFAASYDETMLGELEYRAPALLEGAITAWVGGRRPLDILDLGCGTGLSGQVLRSRARVLMGVDLSPTMVERARAREVYDVLHVAEITAFLQADANGQFGLITACDALIYFGDLRQVVVPAASRLAPDGVMAFTVERGDAYPFTLTDSGRFTHHRDHVIEVAAAASLSVVALSDVVLRYEYGNPVAGLVAVLECDPRSAGAAPRAS